MTSKVMFQYSVGPIPADDEPYAACSDAKCMVDKGDMNILSYFSFKSSYQHKTYIAGMTDKGLRFV